jgi:hypothetical protein
MRSSPKPRARTIQSPRTREGSRRPAGDAEHRFDSVTPVTPVPRSFYAAAFLTGVAYANVAVALPLYAIMLGRPASFAGGLLAAHTLAIAFGAVGSMPVLGRDYMTQPGKFGKVLLAF